MITIIIKLIIALLLTIIIETSLAIILKIRNKKDLLNIVLINIITNLSLNIFILLSNIIFKRLIINIIILEIIVVLIEALFYKKKLAYKKINPFILSLLLNVISYSIGLLIKI